MSKKNHVIFVLDRSSSMDGFRSAVVESFNANVEDVKQNAKKTRQETTVSFVTFGDTARVEYRGITTNALKPLTSGQYAPYGMTALYDGIGSAISLGEALPNAKRKDTSFLVIVQTDGGENNSRKFDQSNIQFAIREKQMTDRWTFAVLCPPGYRGYIANQLGVPPGNIREWEASSSGAREASTATTQGLGNYFSDRSKGLTRSTSFYVTTDLSDVKSKDVRKQLRDLQDDYLTFKVPSECEIAEFCAKKSRKPYRKGAAFYQLTKPETIQENKEILVVEKGKSAVYGGADAREVLGLPDTRCRVTPGNHAQWDIYVQSTSTNRKLVRGSTVLYRRA